MQHPSQPFAVDFRSFSRDRFTKQRMGSIQSGDALSGVKTALERGADAAVSLLGQNGGFLDNPKVHIPLPGVPSDAAKVLEAMGQQKKVDELVTAMNRAAEAAVPQAKALLKSAVKNMGVDDARKPISGGEDSVARVSKKVFGSLK